MKAAIPFMAFVAGASILPAAIPLPRRQPAQQTLRADVNVVSLYFTVRDKRERLVTDLTKNAFKVFEDGKPQEITFFAHHTDVPMDVGVLLDTSTAMARTLGLEADAASRFFQIVMRPNDQGFLVSYAGHIDVLQVPTEDAKSLSSKAQVIRKGARIFDDSPSQAHPMPSPFPLPGGGRMPMPIPSPPSNIPNAASLRVARLYDAVDQSVDRFLRQEI